MTLAAAQERTADWSVTQKTKTVEPEPVGMRVVTEGEVFDAVKKLAAVLARPELHPEVTIVMIDDSIQPRGKK